MLRFSIIIPTYNRADLLKEAIDSVLKQTYENWELIIVDDGSIDHTKEVVISYQDARIHYHYQLNKERSAARNKGVDLSKGDYICFLDDDDIYDKEYLQEFNNGHIDYPDNILRTGFIAWSKTSRSKAVNYQLDQHFNPVRFAAYNMCGVWSLSIPRRCFEKHKFEEGFPHWQDTHLILRLLAVYEFKQMDTYNYLYRIHDTMGSVKLVSESQFNTRLNFNLNAIRHLFDNYGALVASFLPSNTKSFLLSEKTAQYSVNAIPLLGPAAALRIFKSSFVYGLHPKLWRYIISFIYRSWIYVLSRVRNK